MRIVKTKRGARIMEGEVTLSEIRSDPGPTNTLFDVLAACVAALSPGPRFAMLGFAGGGMIAPLRAMGYLAPIDAVDLSRAGEKVFRDLSGTWAGKVTVTKTDAVKWLQRGTRHYDVIVEDLSIDSPAGTVKPYASYDPLPGLIQKRLAADGVAIINLLPMPGTSWDSQLMQVARLHPRAATMLLDEYENRFVIAGDQLPRAAAISRRVRGALRRIGSYQADLISVRTMFRD